MLKKIIAIVETKLNANDIDKFGFEFYKSKGIPVEIYNISAVSRPEYFRKYVRHENIFGPKIDYQKFFCQKTELLKELKNNLDANIFLYTHNRDIISLLNRNNIKYYCVQSGSLPVPKITFLEKLYYSFIFPKVAFPKIIEKIKRLNSYDKLKPKLLFSSSINEDNNNLIKIPSYDCDYLIKWNRNNKKNIKSKIVREYALYIETPCSHPDGIYAANRFPPETPCKHEDYYKPINTFFKKICEDMDLDIKILMHPRSTNNDIDAIKYGRKIDDNKIECFRNAKIVLCFGSAAVSFAAIFNKPIIFMTHDKLTFHNRRNIKYLASHFNKKPIDLNKFNFTKKDNLYEINIKDYDNFKINYFGNANGFLSHEIIYDLLYRL